jgi:nitrite reductase/ring-hydroxylating ferredoxin subunit
MPYTKIADIDEIAVGQGTLIERGGMTIAVFNAGGGRFYATSPTCPHEDGPLAEGWLEGDAVICPWHGYDFELASGACRVASGLKISVYSVRVNGTAVEIDLP